jgi:CubicO group peptidase (beta-lactamase class C family)
MRAIAASFAVAILAASMAIRGSAASYGGDAVDAAQPKVDEYIAAQMAAQKIPGLALAVVRHGEIVKAQGYGLANIELDVPVKPETIFQTGSVGKQFAATAVMMLVEEGKVSLDDKISKYLPGTPPTWSAITVRNLLTHTSGIPDYTGEDKSGSNSQFNFRQDYSEDELLAKFETLPLSFAPGTKWSYSNSGYVLIGIIIRKVTGEFYGDFLRQRIFGPLAMNATRIISEDDIIPNRAAGYRLVNGQIKNQEWVAPSLNTTADGALYTNVLDLSKWDAALYTEKLLKKPSLDAMWTPVRLANGKTADYGFGWDVVTVNGHRLVEHGGSWQGFTMQISRYLDDGLTVIVMTNLDSEHSDPEKIAHHVAGLYLPAVMPKE